MELALINMVSETAEVVVGWIAASLITCLNFPQVIKTYQIKDASGLAWGMIMLHAASGSLWITYGVLLQKPPIFVANSIYFCTTMALAFMKYTFNGDVPEAKTSDISMVTPCGVTINEGKN